MSFQSMKEIVNTANEKNASFWEVILENDMLERQKTREESMSDMLHMYEAMKLADENYDENQISRSGLCGMDGGKIQKALDENKLMVGDFIGNVMAKAVKMGESNACMKRIVAAPTAGSCGVLSAVLLVYEDTYKISKEELTKALYVGAGIGQVIAVRASIAGAQGGCQAEIGSASGMAAGALAYLRGGTTEQILDAAAIALKSLLGLVCDPVAGLVEVPCVKRNVIGAVNAVTAADMVIAGVESKIPLDEVIDAMAEIGEAMPLAYKETSQGGLAMTETGQEYVHGVEAKAE